MIQDNNGSIYDFVDSEFKAPEVESKRAVGWQANRADNTKPYVNNQPSHVTEAMAIVQEDLGYYAYQRFAFNHPVRDAFEQEVNKAFGKLIPLFNFQEQREKYIILYKQHMEK